MTLPRCGRFAWLLCACGLGLGIGRAAAAEWSYEVQGKDRVRILLDGEMFTEYLAKNGPKPILWPIIGPGGREMTRAYPMRMVEGEKHDHPHQRSLWFTHGDVDGIEPSGATRRSPVPSVRTT